MFIYICRFSVLIFLEILHIFTMYTYITIYVYMVSSCKIWFLTSIWSCCTFIPCYCRIIAPEHVNLNHLTCTWFACSWVWTCIELWPCGVLSCAWVFEHQPGARTFAWIIDAFAYSLAFENLSTLHWNILLLMHPCFSPCCLKSCLWIHMFHAPWAVGWMSCADTCITLHLKVFILPDHLKLLSYEPCIAVAYCCYHWTVLLLVLVHQWLSPWNFL